METRKVAVPRCSVVSGQIDLNTGGAVHEAGGMRLRGYVPAYESKIGTGAGDRGNGSCDSQGGVPDVEV